MSKPYILQLNNISYSYQQKGKTALKALVGASLSVAPGECVGIVGQSGCGKTTLANIALGLLRPNEGSVCFAGKCMQTARDWHGAYSQLQAVFQNPAESFDPRKTLGYSVAEPLRNAGSSKNEARRKAQQLMGECGLSAELYDRFPHEVSGGQCQRAAIARALAPRPKLLVCDEATSALDVTAQQRIVELLRAQQQQRKMAMLFISHDISLVAALCSRIAVMQNGQIVEQGSAQQIIQNPAHEYTKLLLESAL